MKQVEEMEYPVNANERFLYGIAMRLEILIDQVSSLCEYIASKDNVSTESNSRTITDVQEVKPATQTKKRAKATTKE